MITKIDINDVKVSGYLGNQLFMYAAMIGYAKKYYGDNWKSKVVIPDLEDSFWEKNLKNLPWEFLEGNGIKTYTESHFNYSPILFEDKLNISGYFQSWKYFEGAEKEVREALEFNDKINNSSFLKTVSSSKSVIFSLYTLLQYYKMTGIHVRLGDYQKLSNHYTQLLETDYYKKAIELLNSETDYFLIFSNDLDQCRKYFNWSDKFIFCDSPQEKTEGNSSAINDLYLMSCCSNFIIANSSMSWWGAWLIRNRDKIIIAPKQWFGPALQHNDTKDLIPPEWIQL